jgi:tetratricopeptide (TPR) repeat protein
LQANPTYATARYDLALAEMKLERLADAERDLRAALAVAPQFARARFALGAVLLREGQRDQARLAFEAAAQSAQDPSLRELANSMRDSI